MIGLAITCYNAPDKLRNLLYGLQTHGLLRYPGEMWINDQSTAPDASQAYRDICAAFGLSHVSQPQEGASASKRQILETAWDNGIEILHQMSEDFEVNTSPSHVTRGLDSFLEDSENLFSLKSIDFVKWNIITPPDGDMHYLWKPSAPGLQFNLTSGLTLPYLSGDIVYSNWPGTWKVSSIRRMWEESKSWNPPDDWHANLVKQSGGEWAASMSRIVKGVCLVAQPLVHSRRHTERAEGSKP